MNMQEILNTMKNWYYLDYMDKVAIVNSIFEEYKNMLYEKWKEQEEVR